MKKTNSSIVTSTNTNYGQSPKNKKEMGIMKKISMVLALVLALTFIPANVFAAEIANKATAISVEVVEDGKLVRTGTINVVPGSIGMVRLDEALSTLGFKLEKINNSNSKYVVSWNKLPSNPIVGKEMVSNNGKFALTNQKWSVTGPTGKSIDTRWCAAIGTECVSFANLLDQIGWHQLSNNELDNYGHMLLVVGTEDKLPDYVKVSGDQTMSVGGTQTLKVVSNLNRISFRSSNPAVLAVDSSNGTVVAKNIGKATVTVRAGAATEKFEVTVTAAATKPGAPPIVEIPAGAAELSDSFSLANGFNALMKSSSFSGAEGSSKISGDHASLMVAGKVTLAIGTTWDVYVTSGGKKNGYVMDTQNIPPLTNAVVELKAGDSVEIWKVGVIVPSSGYFKIDKANSMQALYNKASDMGILDARWSKQTNDGKGNTFYVIVPARGVVAQIDVTGRIAYLRRNGETNSERVYGVINVEYLDTLELWQAPNA